MSADNGIRGKLAIYCPFVESQHKTGLLPQWTLLADQFAQKSDTLTSYHPEFVRVMIHDHSRADLQFLSRHGSRLRVNQDRRAVEWIRPTAT